MEDKIILLVEDNPTDVSLILRAFEKSRMLNKVVIARDGEEALDYLFGTGVYAGRDVTDTPMVILLDLRLPKISGLEVLQRLRANEHTRLVPVVVLTASMEDKDVLESYHLGANSFVRKPLDLNEFVEAISHLGLYWLVINEIPRITNFSRFEQEMVRIDWLNLVGQMAPGIAHQLRNRMTGVRGFLQMINEREEFLAHRDYIKLMLGELDAANSIISQFLFLTKRKGEDLTLQNLNTLLESLLPLIKAEAADTGKDIFIQLEDVPDLMLNEKEIQHLTLNLVRNGLEAMPEGGHLTLRTAGTEEYVVLSVQDQGTGIDPNTMNQLGTPFFTTKPEGTGLGLATCYTIARKHNARMIIETGPAGTTFHVRFKRPD